MVEKRIEPIPLHRSHNALPPFVHRKEANVVEKKMVVSREKSESMTGFTFVPIVSPPHALYRIGMSK